MYCRDLIERNLYYAIKAFAEDHGIKTVDVRITEMIDLFTYDLTYTKEGEKNTVTIII